MSFQKEREASQQIKSKNNNKITRFSNFTMFLKQEKNADIIKNV